MRCLLIACLVVLILAPARAQRPPGMPDRLDIETWLLPGQRIASMEEEDPSALLRESPIRYEDLDGDGAYEVVLLTETPDDNPERIPPERSWLSVYVKSGRSWDRMLLHDAREGRFRHLSFPDMDGDGKKEILYSMGSAHVPDFDRFALLRPGGYYYRPWQEFPRKIWLVTDLNGDGRLDVVTRHRYEPDGFLLLREKGGLQPADFSELKDHLRLHRFRLYQELLRRQETRLERFGVDAP